LCSSRDEIGFLGLPQPLKLSLVGPLHLTLFIYFQTRDTSPGFQQQITIRVGSLLSTSDIKTSIARVSLDDLIGIIPRSSHRKGEGGASEEQQQIR
jgi:hypothetical protein